MWTVEVASRARRESIWGGMAERVADVTPGEGVMRTAEEARREKNWTDAVKKGPLMAADRNPCERCGELFTVPRRAPHKRFCTERCQRNAESERYRQRHTERAWCPRCGEGFERATGTARGRVYCSTRCQYAERSAEYQKREDIRAGIARARALRRPRGDASNALERKVAVLAIPGSGGDPRSDGHGTARGGRSEGVRVGGFPKGV